MVILLPLLALATPDYDPEQPAEVYTGAETYTLDGELQLWSAIERHEDPDRSLFTQQSFNEGTAWPTEAAWAPHIATCFGSAEPHSSRFLLHLGLRESLGSGTPILFVPGAGDNGSRGFITLATHMDELNRPVYALSFAHPHGDVFQQAEVVADAIARIRARTGAAQVDVVAHSKGGIAAATYASHHEGASWSEESYGSVGTRYRGDIRRLVLVATPLSGVDTSYRWTNINLMALDAQTAISPSSWASYYPLTSLNQLVVEELADQDFLPDGQDLFPGQRQLLARQPYDLPGSMPATLGSYALQTDWLTTYEGGLGLYSDSDGIDAAIEAGEHFLDQLADAGVDPAVELYLLAGDNPLMPSGAEEGLTVELYGRTWDIPTQSAEQWAEFSEDLLAAGLLPHALTEAELQGLADEALVLGEVSGPSDGLVFTSSALEGAVLGGRGARVVESYVADLSHLDLLYASPITGELLIEASAEDPADAWMASFGERYTEADTIGWVERVLADAAPPDTDLPGDSGADPDTGLPPEPDTGAPADTAGDLEEDSPRDSGDTGQVDYRPCGGCASPGLPLSLGAWVLAAALVRTRRS